MDGRVDSGQMTRDPLRVGDPPSAGATRHIGDELLHDEVFHDEFLGVEVQPTPATHAMLIQLKAGETVYQG